MSTSLFLLLTVLFWGAAPIFDKLGLGRATALQGLAVRSAVATSVLLMGLLFSGKLREAFNVPPKEMAFFAASGVLAGLLGVFTYYLALKTASASKVVPLASAYPLVAFILSIFILGENFSVSKLLGTCFIIGGVLLLK